MTTISTTVEIDLSAFEDHEIVDEARSRGFDPRHVQDWLDMRSAFYANDDAKALTIAKKLCAEHTGQELP